MAYSLPKEVASALPLAPPMRNKLHVVLLVNLWNSRLGFFFGGLVWLTFFTPGYSQEATSRVEVEGSVGVSSYHQSLSADKGLALGLGVGYRIRTFLQLGLNFSVNPTQQQITTAVSKLTSDLVVYKYNVNLRMIKSRPIAALLRPFLKTGIGGLILNPGKSTLSLGGGTAIVTEPASDHKVAVNIGIGFYLRLGRTFSAVIHAEKYFYRLDQVEGLSVVRKITASDTYFGLGLATQL